MTSTTFESNVVTDLCVPSLVNIIDVGPDSLPEIEAISLEAGCSIQSCAAELTPIDFCIFAAASSSPGRRSTHAAADPRWCCR